MSKNQPRREAKKPQKAVPNQRALSPAAVKSRAKIRDLRVVRQYYINGINILCEIDFIKKKASFVEPDSSYRHQDYRPKEWVFAEREPDYLKTWVKILDALKQATELVIKELEQLKDAEWQQTIKALAQMSRDRDV